jgi:hypothetical protein
MTTLYIIKMQLTQLLTKSSVTHQIAHCQKQLIKPVLLPTCLSETNLSCLTPLLENSNRSLHFLENPGR